MLGDMNVTLSAESKRRMRIQALCVSLGLTGASIAWMIDPPASSRLGNEIEVDARRESGSCTDAWRGANLELGAQRRARVERQCLDAGGGAACDTNSALRPREALCLAESAALGHGTADRLGLVYRSGASSLVWRVIDDATGASVELDAETGDLLRWSR